MAEDQPEGSTTATVTTVSPEMVAITLLGQAVTAGFRETNANIQLVANDLSLVKGRVDILESERTRFSGGVRALSGADLSHEAQLAAERAAREDLAKQVAALATTNATQLAILGRLDNIAKNPLVKTVGAMLLTALVTWLATHGIQVPK